MANSLKSIICTLVFVAVAFVAQAQKGYTFSGRVTTFSDDISVVGAAVVIDGGALWAITDGEGNFAIHNIASQLVTVEVSSLGYVAQKFEVDLTKAPIPYIIKLAESNLAIDEVVVTAQRRTESNATSFVVDRTTLDHSQMVNVSNITTLLPGGKTTGDQNLASGANRIALNTGSGSEMGNASFGTAIDIDGMRLGNNAAADELKGVDLRNVGVSNIESVEIVTGIPSVEYGDLSNGIVKINTRKGRSPFIIDIMFEPKTKQIALSKGFKLSKKAGTINLNAERTRSITNLSSPYTAYERNNLNINYSNTFKDHRDQPLHFSFGLSGNFGGYNSKADPDQFKDTYTKMRDYALRGNIKLNWLINRSWITNLTLQATASYSDRTTLQSENKNSASTQPFIHSTEQGYFVGEIYDKNPDANIILSPTGYWYLHSVVDTKPVAYSLKAKADHRTKWGHSFNMAMIGAELTGSGNLGRGLYYEDMRYAPTWREYSYREQPFMNNAALFVEDDLKLGFSEHSSLGITAGVRADMTMVKNTPYGTVASLSPRVSARYAIWEDAPQTVSSLVIYGGWGKSVKQPSFAVLNPRPTYSDSLAFAPGTTADGTTFYAYYTQPTTPLYNPDLKWQHTNQSEIGIEATIAGTRISLSLFRNRTINPYITQTIYTPFSYKLTTQANLEADCTIPSANREYLIDQKTGIVTVRDITGAQQPQTIGYKERRTFVGQTNYTNGSPIERRGVNLIVDFAEIHAIRTRIRFDGNYYYYKGTNQHLTATTLGNATMSNGDAYKYIGYFAGTSSVSNGRLSREVNANLTIITHIPKVRMIFSVRLESSLYNYSQNLSEYADGTPRGYRLEESGDYIGSEGNLYNEGKYVAVYPEYYSTWENPNELIPFAEKFLWAKENDPQLYNDLARLVEKTNTNYYFNSNRTSAYVAANFNLTKEIGRFASISFYARNFFYHMGKVRSSQTGLESSLFDSGIIPKFYYGLSLKLKF
ncbi:MAG: TonB-dependent receptor [Alistipes sp.]|nr:TonB-dependent receptor [Alistipes sp.]